jgi:2-polyprenyl-3-methyl-5-hydroxy-6-metoxy-1,4-benzoquinol methylase
MPEAYSEHFQNTAEATQYEAGEYAPKSYSCLLWEIEQSQLSAVIQQLRQTRAVICALDFATGTGRIASFLETQVDSVTGIEISGEMCELAKKKVSRSDSRGKIRPHYRVSIFSQYRAELASDGVEGFGGAASRS